MEGVGPDNNSYQERIIKPWSWSSPYKTLLINPPGIPSVIYPDNLELFWLKVQQSHTEFFWLNDKSY